MTRTRRRNAILRLTKQQYVQSLVTVHEKFFLAWNLGRYRIVIRGGLDLKNKRRQLSLSLFLWLAGRYCYFVLWMQTPHYCLLEYICKSLAAIIFFALLVQSTGSMRYTTLAGTPRTHHLLTRDMYLAHGTQNIVNAFKGPSALMKVQGKCAKAF